MPPPVPLNNQQALQTAQAGSAAITDPNNPLGATHAPQISAIHDITYQGLQTGAAANAAVNSAQVQVANQKAQEAALKDPSKYTRVQAPDGGWNFFGPDGKPVSASQYASVLGTNPAKVLQDSQNPIDIAFQQDYEQLQQYFKDRLNAKYNSAAADNAAATEKAVAKAYPGVDLAKLNPRDVALQFQQAYPTVFGLHTTGPQGINALLPPAKVPDTTANADTSL